MPEPCGLLRLCLYPEMVTQLNTLRALNLETSLTHSQDDINVPKLTLIIQYQLKSSSYQRSKLARESYFISDL